MPALDFLLFLAKRRPKAFRQCEVYNLVGIRIAREFHEDRKAKLSIYLSRVLIDPC